MEKENNHFLKKLFATFKVEAQEHIKALSLGLIELEKASTPEKQVEVAEAIFREAHSLKGAAGSVNLIEIVSICQSLENVFAVVKRKEIALSPGLFDLLHQAVDCLRSLVSQIGTQPAASEISRLAELIERLRDTATGAGSKAQGARGGERGTRSEERGAGVGGQGSGVSGQWSEFSKPMPDAAAHVPDARTPSPAATETIRVSASKLTSILLQTEELLFAKLAVGQKVAELREIKSAFAMWKKEWVKLHPEIKKIQYTPSSSFSLPDFFDRNYTYLRSLENRFTALLKSAERDHHSLGRMVDVLLEDMKKVLMLPFSSVLEVFPKLVRELSREQGKEVDLVIRGENIEIDRRILEAMKDPLIHLVRNCVDHGIEKPNERVQNKKPSKGLITIAAHQKNSRAEIIVSDDGNGIDITKIKTAAVKLGFLSNEEAEKMKDSEILPLIFQSGVTTSLIITDISGRGLGLSIVREKVENLGGTVSFETNPGSGTIFRIALPLTLATFRGVIIKSAEHLFVLPTTHVERVVRINRDEIKTVENRETVELNGQVVSLVRLEEVLELSRQGKSTLSTENQPAMVIASGEKRIAFAVDEVINEQEVLQKNLGKQLSRVRNVAGAAVLGTGNVVPILNAVDLMKSAVRISATAMRPALAPSEIKEARRPSLLVVEDSITARMLLKNILETAGYAVATAVDGIDAFTKLKSEEFALVVSDVDMPRMNGFDLTAKIRADKKLVDLPVVLVTALESREDRERGIEVGANAYIVKSSFDQSNLLEIIRRLI